MATSEIHDVCPKRFEETHWSVIFRARQANESGSEALEKLCRAYRLPLYSFVRRRGFERADAEDLVQDFFLKLLDRRSLQRVDPAMGKFRSFLLAMLKNFLANEWDSRQALKRGGAYHFVSLEDPNLEALYHGIAASQDDADKIFDRSWAVALVRQAMAELAEEYAAEGRTALFEAVKSCLSTDGRTFEYPAVAATLGMREDNVRMAVNRLRRRFGELLRQHVKTTLPDQSAVEDELKYLLSCL